MAVVPSRRLHGDMLAMPPMLHWEERQIRRFNGKHIEYVDENKTKKRKEDMPVHDNPFY